MDAADGLFDQGADFQDAEAHFQNALRTAMEAWAPAQALHTLLSMANLLAAVGEKEQSLEVASLVRHHQASWQWTKDHAAALVGELTSERPSGAARLASDRCRDRKIESLVSVLLGEAV